LNRADLADEIPAMREGQMVREFVKTALEGDKEDVAGHEQGLLLKTFRASRDTLQLARRTARETRVTMALAAVAVALLVFAIYMLWRVLEHLPS
jgi:hypothetical protein